MTMMGALILPSESRLAFLILWSCRLIVGRGFQNISSFHKRRAEAAANLVS